MGDGLNWLGTAVIRMGGGKECIKEFWWVQNVQMEDKEWDDKTALKWFLSKTMWESDMGGTGWMYQNKVSTKVVSTSEGHW